MTPQTARQRMNDIQAAQRPYIPALLRRLALTYGLPLGAALLLATVGAVLLSSVIPSSTATAVVFALNVALFYYGWNALEKRTRATALFTLYVAGTRERRTLERLIRAAEAQRQPATASLAEQVARYEASAQNFIEQVDAAP
jgi:hypothetical protein